MRRCTCTASGTVARQRGVKDGFTTIQINDSNLGTAAPFARKSFDSCEIATQWQSCFQCADGTRMSDPLMQMANHNRLSSMGTADDNGGDGT